MFMDHAVKFLTQETSFPRVFDGLTVSQVRFPAELESTMLFYFKMATFNLKNRPPFDIQEAEK